MKARVSNTNVSIFPPYRDATDENTSLEMEICALPNNEVALRIWIEVEGQRSGKVVFFLPWTVEQTLAQFPNAVVED